MGAYQTILTDRAEQERRANVKALNTNADAMEEMFAARQSFFETAATSLAVYMQSITAYNETRGVSASGALDNAVSQLESNPEDDWFLLLRMAYDKIT